MFCPRCGRPVNPEANFCGGCGLSKVEIEKYLQKTAPQQPAQEVKTEAAPQPEPPKPESVAEPVVQVKTYPDVEANAEPASAEQPKAEPVFTEPEDVKAESAEQPEKSAFQKMKEEIKAEDTTPPLSSTAADNNCTYAYSYKNADSSNAQGSTDTYSTSEQYGYTNAQYTQAQPTYTAPEAKKEVPLSTVDFIWMLVICSLPVIGLIYVIYLAVQDNNINKRSYARATLIVSVFSIIIALVFAVGVIAAGLI